MPSTTTAADRDDEQPSVQSFLGAVDFQQNRLHPLANLGKLEYIELDQAGGGQASSTRGWSDDLTYGTGIVYISALGTGGIWGLREGLAQAAKGSTTSAKLRVNYVLNAVTRRGPMLGNSAAVVVMTYHCTNALVSAMVNRPRDLWTGMTAGALAAAIFRSSAGLRAAGMAGVMGAGVAAAWSFAQRRLGSFY